jgi:hypothetical protein
MARSRSGRGAHAARLASRTSAVVRLVLCLAALPGCARVVADRAATALAETPNHMESDGLSAGAAVEVRKVELMNGFVQLRLDVPSSPPGPKPTVVSLLDERERLLEMGMVVASYRQNWEPLKALAPPPPAEPPPKNTVGVWLLAAPTPKTVGKGWFAMIALDAENVLPKVLDHLGTVPEVDATRMAIIGSSTKGFAALRAAADRRIAAAVVLAACGDYHTFLHLSPLAMNGARLDLDERYDAELRALEPVRHPERFTHAAVLMMNGTADAAVPIECARSTARAFERAYARAGVPERFRFVEVNGAGHNDLGAGAPEEVGAWLHRWLRPEPPGA